MNTVGHSELKGELLDSISMTSVRRDITVETRPVDSKYWCSDFVSTAPPRKRYDHLVVSF